MPIPVFAQAGDKMIFLNKNGYDSERAQAAGKFEEGNTYTVKEARIGNSTSNYVFEEVDGLFNTVMFEFDDLEALAAEDGDKLNERVANYANNLTYIYYPLDATEYDAMTRKVGLPTRDISDAIARKEKPKA